VFSPLQLRDYLIELLQVEANPDFVAAEGTSYEGSVGVEFDFRRQEETKLFRVDLDIVVNPTQEMLVRAPYRIRIKFQTILEFEGEYPEEQIPALLGPNGLAMAYSIARGIVGQTTASSLHGKFILPTVNFMELLKHKAEAMEESAKKTS